MSTYTAPYEEKMKKTISSYEHELNTIRAGRANPHVLDKLVINYFGADTPVNQLGNITVPEARILQIQPWDSSALKLIEKAVQASDIGINPTNDGKVIRLVFPELTQERRQSLSKDVKKKAEDFKVAVRNVRRDAIDHFKKIQKSSEITEDKLKELEVELQKLTDKYIADIDKTTEAKTKEIMSI